MRIHRLLSVAFFLEVGLLLIVLPWSRFWDANYFVGLRPGLHTILTNNFVRGAISGLGIVNVGAAFADLARMFDDRDGPSGIRLSDRSGPQA